MTRRRLGASAVRQLASTPSLEAAVSALAQSTYGRQVRPGQTLVETQRAVVAALGWNARVLAGWSPPEGVTMLRVLVAPLELSNVEDHLQRLAGADVPDAFGLGGLATAWPRLRAAADLREVRSTLAASAWGDPGGETARDIGLSMRASLGDRVIAAVPPAGSWAAGAVALLVAREVTLLGHRLPSHTMVTVARVIGRDAASAATLPALAAALPRNAQWALDAVEDPRDLWRAEARWWARVDKDSTALVRRATAGPEVLVGAVGLMAVDAWRVRAALEVAARAGRTTEDFHAVA